MPPEAITTSEKTAVQQVKEQLESVAKRMRRDQPVHIQLSNGNSVELKSSLLDTITSGQQFTEEEWGAILDILIRPRFPNVLINISDDAKIPPLKDKQQCFWLPVFRNCLGRLSTCFIIAMQHSVPKVRICAVREESNVDGPHLLQAEDLGNLLGVEWHKIVYKAHLELPLKGADQYPFQDAVLFDMLLDLVIGSFKPHTRGISDGPGLQLQLLSALEREQLKTEAAHGFDSNKRKLTIEERLDGKRMKKE